MINATKQKLFKTFYYLRHVEFNNENACCDLGFQMTL